MTPLISRIFRGLTSKLPVSVQEAGIGRATMLYLCYPHALSTPFLRPCNTCSQKKLCTLSCHDGLLKDKAVCCGCGSYVVDDGTCKTVESSLSSGHKRRRLWRKSMICTSFMFSGQVRKNNSWQCLWMTVKTLLVSVLSSWTTPEPDAFTAEYLIRCPSRLRQSLRKNTLNYPPFLVYYSWNYTFLEQFLR